MVIKRETKKQGNSVMINIPPEFNVGEDEEYSLIKKNDGTIMLIPEIENYFKNASTGEFYNPLEWEDIAAEGREFDV